MYVSRSSTTRFKKLIELQRHQLLCDQVLRLRIVGRAFNVFTWLIHRFVFIHMYMTYMYIYIYIYIYIYVCLSKCDQIFNGIHVTL